jgi:4-cresol dehydrogenase (hydroxylating)
MSLTVSTGVSEATLDKAIERFVSALDSERVLTAPDNLREFRDPFEPEAWDTYTPSVVVLPRTVEEVQAVVRIASELAIPLWTHGQGRNNGYGGAAPRVKGSVTVSLRQMNRVLEINEEMGYAVVEPGTTWLQLYEAIESGGHDLLLSCTDLGWGSVVGNSLDHGLTYTPYGQDFMAPCGMEVVLASGEVLRTGMGAMTGNSCWHLYRRGLGPTLDQLFMQSNFGIVTRMGLWLHPRPEIVMPAWVRVWNEQDLVPLIDTLRRLRLDRTLEAVPVLYNTLIYASGATRRADWFDGDGPIPDGVIDRIAKEIASGRWMLRMALFGDEPVVDHNFAKIKTAFEQIPGGEVWGTKYAARDAAKIEHPAELVAVGVPNMELNHQTGWYGEEQGGHIGFSPVVPLRGEECLRVHKLLRETIERDAGLDYMVGSVAINARSTINIGFICFDVKDEAQARRAYDTSKLLVSAAAEHGYGEYRAHLDFMDLAQSRYDFGDGAYLRFVERIKDAVDPEGILSPGKQGIWPAHMRGARNGGK